MKLMSLGAMVALSLIATLFLSQCGGAPPKPTYDHCKGIGAEAGDIWNQGLKNRLNFPKKIFAGTITAADAEFFVRNLDKFVTDWQTVRFEACKEDPPPKPQDTSPPPNSAKVQCLETVLARFDVLIDKIKVSTDIEYERLTGIFEELSTCAGRLIPPALEPKDNPFEDDTDSSTSSDEEDLENGEIDDDEELEDEEDTGTSTDVFSEENPF